MTPEEARKLLVDRFDLCGAGCEKCEQHPYAELRHRNEDGSVTVLESFPAAEGWELVPWGYAVIRKCQSCKDSRPYEWLRRLDAERVAAWVNEKHGDMAFLVNELKELL